MTFATKAVDNRSAMRVIVLALILAALGGVKLSFLPGTGPYSLDGSFYVNAARNVEEGVGLKTNVSMYHRGDVVLPTRSRLIYPLWPLLLGYTARAIGLVRAINVLTALFYLIDLVLLYILVRRLQERMWGPTNEIFTPAHLLVLLLGLNLRYFVYTTLPYTEGLGFFLAFSALLLMDCAASRKPALYGSLAGIAAGLALLTRTQLVVLGLVIAIAVVWVALSDRRYAPAAMAYAIAYSAMFTIWYYAFFRIEETAQVPIPGFHMWTKPLTTADWLRERLDGLIVSFSPLDQLSYFASFGLAFLIPIIAGVVALVRWFRVRRFRLRIEAALPAACALFGLGTYGSLNLFHLNPNYWDPWLFSYRHSLPMIAGIAVAAVYLWNLGKLARATVLVTGALTVVMATIALLHHITTPRRPSPTAAESQMAAWLDRQHPRPSIIGVKAQHLSVVTHANVYWTECKTPRATTRLMLEKLPVDYVIVYDFERRCEFVRGLGDVLVERAAFGDGADRIHIVGRRTIARR